MPRELLTDRRADWQQLLQLRCQHEIVERWLQTVGVPDLLQEQLRFMLQSIEQELQSLEAPSSREGTARMREAS
jgi:hypothetical protein